jgi:hypothetical protein
MIYGVNVSGSGMKHASREHQPKQVYVKHISGLLLSERFKQSREKLTVTHL